MASFLVRPATASDYAAYTTLLPLIGADLTVLTREAWCAELLPTTLVASDNDGVLGYCYYQPLAGVGYIRHVVTASRSRRMGVGRALLLAVARELQKLSCSKWELNVEPGNVAATSLYQRLGMRCAYPSTAIRWRWANMARLHGDDDLQVRTLAAADDAALEASFKLVPGQLNDARVRAGRVLLRVDDDARCLGLAVFDPAFPGAFPFRVQARAARGLLAAIQPHAPRDKASISLVVEGDATLRQALCDAGGIVIRDLEHYEGAAPQN